MNQNLITHSENETIEAGKIFARRLMRGNIVAMYGDLGAGKTRFLKGVCAGLGVQEHVTSPTFTIVNEYQGLGLTVYHFDFYRIDSLAEMQEIGFEDYLTGDGVCLIEWADRIAELLPPNRYDVYLQLGTNEEEREIVIEQRVAANA